MSSTEKLENASLFVSMGASFSVSCHCAAVSAGRFVVHRCCWTNRERHPIRPDNGPPISARAVHSRRNVQPAPQRPDGIEPHHVREPTAGHANPIGLIVLGTAMVVALLGFAGSEVDRSASGNGVTLSWHGPERIRNGEFFELRITVTGSERVGRLVLGIDASLWEDFTINTFIPGAEAETSREGEFLFDFGELAAGETLLVKVDAQINPDKLGANSGTLTAYDGDQALTELALTIEVRP
jgi:hypothetical protein